MQCEKCSSENIQYVKYKQYEREKKKLQEICKTSEEYEEKIRELVKKLGV